MEEGFIFYTDESSVMCNQGQNWIFNVKYWIFCIYQCHDNRVKNEWLRWYLSETINYIITYIGKDLDGHCANWLVSLQQLMIQQRSV